MSFTSQPCSVLVAGGAGYIGSHTAKLLLASGVLPVVLDNLCTGNRSAIQFGPFYEGSIADSALVQKIVKQKRIDSAILFAGHAYVGESAENPRKYFQNNVLEALQFLNALVDSGIRRVIFSSSCSVYGTQESSHLGENSPANPLSPYAETKLFFEKVLRSYAPAYAVSYVILRYFNAAGADPEAQLGEHHNPETHLVPLAIRAAMGGNPLKVFGTDYPTPDGTAIRDYTHVTDLADAHVRALRYLSEGGEPLTLNLGTGRGHSVHQIIRAVEEQAGHLIPVQYAPRRVGDAPSLVADATRARDVLGWSPKYSSIETIVRTAWQSAQSSAGLKTAPANTNFAIEEFA